MGVCNALCFVVCNFVSILALQSPWWGWESWLLCLICLPGVSWWLSGSSSRYHRVVCSLSLWYFLIILVSPFPAGEHKAHINRRSQTHSKHKTEKNIKDLHKKCHLIILTIFVVANIHFLYQVFINQPCIVHVSGANKLRVRANGPLVPLHFVKT